jgi:hypothetical protein
VLAELKAARERGLSGVGRGFLVRSDWLSGEVFGVHDLTHGRLHRTIAALRRAGHVIDTIGGGWSGCSYRLHREATA